MSGKKKNKEKIRQEKEEEIILLSQMR